MENNNNNEININAQIEADINNANWFSKLFFSWIQPLLRLGNKKPLEFDDLPPLQYYYNI